MAAFTGHGFINYPAKESCIGVPSTSIDNQEEFNLRFINLENFARHCASQPNTITIIIDNSCRVYPKSKHNEIKKFMEQNPLFQEDTDGNKSQSLKMPGLAIILFASKKTKPATDEGGLNTGTNNFIERIQQCIDQR